MWFGGDGEYGGLLVWTRYALDTLRFRLALRAFGIVPEILIASDICKLTVVGCMSV